MQVRKYIPNTLTLCNLLAGCAGVVFAVRGNFSAVLVCLMLSELFDFSDGFSARKLKAYSDIGKELDSLADLVSFGLAPAMVLYNMMLGHGAGHWALVALLLPVFGALRLARFNVDTNQTTTFTGLPIPANAIFWIGFTAWYAIHEMPLWIVLLLIVILSLLMVCNLRMFSLKMHSLSSLKQNWAQYLQVVATVAFVLLMGLPGLAAAISLYVLLSIIKREK